MNLSFWLNGVYRHDEVEPDTMLLDFLRDKGCYSIKCGCETSNCGLCTVLMDGVDPFPQYACPSCRRQENCHNGRNAERSRRIWYFSGR